MADGIAVTEHPDPGEVIWRDNGVTCRRWNWRQACRTQLREDTAAALFILAALDPVTDQALHAASADLAARLTRLGPGIRAARRLIAAGTRPVTEADMPSTPDMPRSAPSRGRTGWHPPAGSGCSRPATSTQPSPRWCCPAHFTIAGDERTRFQPFRSQHQSKHSAVAGDDQHAGNTDKMTPPGTRRHDRRDGYASPVISRNAGELG